MTKGHAVSIKPCLMGTRQQNTTSNDKLFVKREHSIKQRLFPSKPNLLRVSRNFLTFVLRQTFYCRAIKSPALQPTVIRMNPILVTN